VLLQGSSAPSTATTPRAQGSGSSLLDTLAYCYTPIEHLDPLLASIKGRARALIRGVVAREDGLTNRLALSLSPSRTLVTPTASASTLAQDNMSRGFPPFVFRLAPTHLGWGTRRQFYSSVQGPPRVETPTKTVSHHTINEVSNPTNLGITYNQTSCLYKNHQV
jgi:hypothetical protein